MNAVVKAEPQEIATSIIQVIANAAQNPQIDAEKMERLFALQERIMATQARAAFSEAMTAAQNDMEPISADATNPQTHSKYASYGKLDKALRPIYTRHGFSLSFSDGETEKADHVRVVCKVRHRQGHEETHWKDMPADGKGAKGGDVMTKTHAAGAAQQYGMRYLLKGIFNVAIGEDDTDGNPPKAKAPEPEGYEKWKADIGAVAEEGHDRLMKVWKDSDMKLRSYAVANDAAWWTTTKNKARKVQS